MAVSRVHHDRQYQYGVNSLASLQVNSGGGFGGGPRGSAVRAEAVSPSGRFLPVDVVEKADGTYSANFTPTESGMSYLVFIYTSITKIIDSKNRSPIASKIYVSQSRSTCAHRALISVSVVLSQTQGRRYRGRRYMYPHSWRRGDIACICTPCVDRSNGVISPLNA